MLSGMILMTSAFCGWIIYSRYVLQAHSLRQSFLLLFLLRILFLQSWIHLSLRNVHGRTYLEAYFR
jgi:hypothetical protein